MHSAGAQRRRPAAHDRGMTHETCWPTCRVGEYSPPPARPHHRLLASTTPFQVPRPPPSRLPNGLPDAALRFADAEPVGASMLRLIVGDPTHMPTMLPDSVME